MTGLPGFTVDIDQNPYLPVGGQEVSAIVTVTAGVADTDGDVPAPSGYGAASAVGAAGGSAEIIIVDCSGSMDYPPAKLVAARAATAAAVDVIKDGTWFAIVAGTSTAWPVYPPDGSMVVADERTRAEARQALRELRANGGTAIGQWLRLAHQIFGRSPATLRHAILLTDGKNQHETPEELAAAIGLCEGTFRCDCRGIGTDWVVSELRKISTALLGTVDIVVDPAALAADFQAMARDAMSKQLPDVVLRVWTPQTAALKFVKQVAPAISDLTGRRLASGAQAGDYPTGAWAPGESRDYHVALSVSPAALGQEMLAARVSLVASSAGGQQVLGQGLIRVTWTDDEALSARINPHVASYTGQAELAAAIQEGLEANKRGDEELATARLGRAVALAHEAGNEDMARLLANVVDVVDQATGTVRLKKKVDAAAEMALDTRSTKTVRVKKG
jgi:von Willebrand factor type A C-terminal domain/von Willebrand factor type A domain